MKRVRKSLQTDLSFILLVVLVFIYFVFLVYQKEYLTDNFLIACAVFIIVLITYFTSLTVGLIINTTLILAALTYVILQSMLKGVVIRPYVYFWIVMSPLLTTAFSLFSASAVQMQGVMLDLDRKLVNMTTLNEETHLKNLRAFENDAGIYMSIAERYDIGFGIVVIQFKYQKEIERLSRKEGMRQVVMEVIGVIRKATRAEDELYQLDDEEILFAMLMLTKKEGLNVIHDRLKAAIAQINTSDILNTRQLVLDMRIGVAFSEGEKDNVMHLLDSAKSAMQYDV